MDPMAPVSGHRGTPSTALFGAMLELALHQLTKPGVCVSSQFHVQ